MMRTTGFVIVLLFMVSSVARAVNFTLRGFTNVVVEWGYVSEKRYDNPFQDVALDVVIVTPAGKRMVIPAYWAGENEWRIRFSSPQAGEYDFKTVCSDENNLNLHNRRGKIILKQYGGENILYKKGPVRISPDNRHFMHYDGTPFFWLADSWWHGMTKRFTWPDDFQLLAADRKAKGFSVIQLAIGFPCDIHPFDERGRNEAGDPWTDSTFNSINPDYFNHTDLRIQWLVSNGLLPNILGMWGYYIKWMGVDKVKTHWKYLIARYGAYPVTWTLSGETTLAYYDDLDSPTWSKYRKQFRKEWSEVASYIQEIDPYNRLLTTHPGPGEMVDGLPPINNMDLLDFVMVQTGHNGFQTLERSTRMIRENLAKYDKKPVLHGEVCFEGMRSTCWEDIQRFLFWSNMMMGTAGFSYGAEGIWQFNTEEELFGQSPGGNTWGNVPWEKAYKYSGSEQVGIGKKILENYEWWKIKPAPDLIQSNENGIFSPYMATMGNDMHILYLYNFPTRHRQTWITNLDGKYKLVFHNPVNGDVYNYHIIKPNKEGKYKIPKPPVMQEWVITIKKVD